MSVTSVSQGAGGRRAFVLAIFLVLASVLWLRAFKLQILDSVFYQKQGDARQIRTLPLAAHLSLIHI